VKEKGKRTEPMREREREKEKFWTHTPYHLAIYTSEHISKEIKSQILNRFTSTYVHINIIHNSKMEEAT
jgi:hypothetical protein